MPHDDPADWQPIGGMPLVAGLIDLWVEGRRLPGGMCAPLV